MKRTVRLCGVAGCGRRHKSRSMCRMHYMQWLRGTPIEAATTVRPPVADRPCSVDGCRENARSMGMCNRHYLVAWRNKRREPNEFGVRRGCPHGCGRCLHDLPAVASPIPELPWPACPGSTIPVSDSETERVSA